MGTLRSQVSVASDVPLIKSTIGHYFDQVASRWPEREALVVCHQGVRWRYREFKARD
jgi:fatty-acyl-CoA synthase